MIDDKGEPSWGCFVTLVSAMILIMLLGYMLAEFRGG